MVVSELTPSSHRGVWVWRSGSTHTVCRFQGKSHMYARHIDFAQDQNQSVTVLCVPYVLFMGQVMILAEPPRRIGLSSEQQRRHSDFSTPRGGVFTPMALTWRLGFVVTTLAWRLGFVVTTLARRLVGVRS